MKTHHTIHGVPFDANGNRIHKTKNVLPSVGPKTKTKNILGVNRGILNNTTGGAFGKTAQTVNNGVDGKGLRVGVVVGGGTGHGKALQLAQPSTGGRSFNIYETRVTNELVIPALHAQQMKARKFVFDHPIEFRAAEARFQAIVENARQEYVLAVDMAMAKNSVGPLTDYVSGEVHDHMSQCTNDH